MALSEWSTCSMKTWHQRNKSIFWNLYSYSGVFSSFPNKNFNSSPGEIIPCGMWCCGGPPPWIPEWGGSCPAFPPPPPKIPPDSSPEALWQMLLFPWMLGFVSCVRWRSSGVDLKVSELIGYLKGTLSKMFGTRLFERSQFEIDFQNDTGNAFGKPAKWAK